jgi:hypothetical protein
VIHWVVVGYFEIKLGLTGVGGDMRKRQRKKNEKTLAKKTTARLLSEKKPKSK